MDKLILNFIVNYDINFMFEEIGETPIRARRRKTHI